MCCTTLTRQLHREANTAVFNREQALSDVYELLEKGFLVQGSSAIEDKLQNDVPQTIKVRTHT